MESIIELYNHQLVQEFLFGTGEHQLAIAPLAVAAIGAAPGLLKSIGSLFGGGKRRRAERQAKRAQRQALRDVKNFKYSQDPTNPYANVDNAFADVTNTAADLTNPYADLRVNTQAAEFQAEQNAQNQANILDVLSQGGGNAAAIATSLAGQSTTANAQISADIARQEAANQQLTAQGEASRQQAFAAGEARRQQLFGQGLQHQQQLQGAGEQYVQQVIETRDQNRQSQNLFMLGRADKSAAAATAARTAARNQLIGGLSQAAGGAFQALSAGGHLGGGGSLPGGGGAPVGSINDPTFSAGGYNASNSFLNNTSGMNLTVPNLGG